MSQPSAPEKTASREAGQSVSAGKCPFDHGQMKPAASAGCPFSAAAASFDPFDEPYQLDPASALRWFRDQEPVFYSDKMGHWIVSRYEDVKAIFRDNRIYSPANALEKVTPFAQEAQDVLMGHGYAMDRTLVNEDEPAHMDRRRALMGSFSVEELAHHEPMVRRLTRDYIDRFIDAGKADLVDQMLWELPLTVALHFLGVPEEDMDTLRKYSIAHTVNTWGRPSPEEQVAVAEAVGQFWRYAGQVLEKMRKEDSGEGWMGYALQRQKDIPEIVTDSYLHSMMMAGIVAAHETTAHASANALKLLLTHRTAWDQLCADPALIPNAVEECLRFSGSIVAWRRLATESTRIGNVEIPKGARLMVVMASANHDERHFENADELDIYRDNTTDHLSFGYGSHQCLGKNLARMEMRIFIEEFTKRLPHMRLVENQKFEGIPNISFHGPEHLWVEWDPERNPERAVPGIVDSHLPLKIGPPARADIYRHVIVTQVKEEADGVLGITLADPGGSKLPGWTPGAHIDVIAGDYVRKYSLCGILHNGHELRVAVLKEGSGRGGSAFIHQTVTEGMALKIRGPRNHFRLDETADDYLLIAGGIGITPIISMADRLKQLGKRYRIHYAGRSLQSMAFIERLTRDHLECVQFYSAEQGGRLQVSSLLDTAAAGTQLYACGPERLLTHLQEQVLCRPDLTLRIEHFSAALKPLDASTEKGFTVDLQDSGLTIQVAPEQTLLQALQAFNVDIPSDCGEGLCGSCEVRVAQGEVDHRDQVLTPSERQVNDRMMACCSRARTGRLVLKL